MDTETTQGDAPDRWSRLQAEVLKLKQENEELKAKIAAVKWWLSPVANTEPNAHGAMLAISRPR